MLVSYTLMHHWFVIPFEKIQSRRWQAFQNTRVGKGKGIFPPGSHEHLPGCASIISPFLLFFSSLFIKLCPFFPYEFTLREALRELKTLPCFSKYLLWGWIYSCFPTPMSRGTSSFLPVVSHHREESSRGSRSPLFPGTLLNYAT